MVKLENENPRGDSRKRASAVPLAASVYRETRRRRSFHDQLPPSPPRRCNRVDLPAPDAPMIAIVPPALAGNESAARELQLLPLRGANKTLAQICSNLVHSPKSRVVSPMRPRPMSNVQCPMPRLEWQPWRSHVVPQRCKPSRFRLRTLDFGLWTGYPASRSISAGLILADARAG